LVNTRRLTRSTLLPSAVLLFAAIPLAAQAPAPAPDSPRAQTEKTGQTDARIRFFQMQVERDPTFPTSYNRLASALALKARESGDISYLQLAEAALDKSLALESTHPDAAPTFTQLATVHLAEHRFREAAADARKAMDLDPGEVSPYPYAGDAELEQGNYEAAQKLYAHLEDPHDERPHHGLAFLRATRAASYDWIMGQPAKASEDMRQAAALAEEIHMPSENVAWTHFMLGEQFFQAGDLASAEKEEALALRAFPRYHRALAEMGRVCAAEGRMDDAITFYRQAIDVVPMPVYAAALGDVYQSLGRKAEAEKQYALVEFIAKLSALNHDVYNRELALFYADHDRNLPLAVELARKELTVRHDVYTWDALAWTLAKNGQQAEAAEAAEKALHYNTQDALLEYHAGYIYSRLGDSGKAATHLKKALALNPNFHIVYAARAREMLGLSGVQSGASSRVRSSSSEEPRQMLHQ
jgi:tetratricopeptide (TPR) repeat protein